jgi:hypothetical protein
VFVLSPVRYFDRVDPMILYTGVRAESPTVL